MNKLRFFLLVLVNLTANTSNAQTKELTLAHEISQEQLLQQIETSQSNLHRNLWLAQLDLAKKEFGSDGLSIVELIPGSLATLERSPKFDGRLSSDGLLNVQTRFTRFRDVVKDQSGKELYTIVDELILVVKVHYVWDQVDNKFIFTILKSSSASSTSRLVPQGGSRDGGSSTGGKTLW